MRNLLIYLQPAARRQLLTRLRERLAPDGVLFVGHAEAGLMFGLDLQIEGDASAFAFSATVREPVPPPRRRAAPKAPPPGVPRPRKFVAEAAAIPRIAKPQPTKTNDDPLPYIRELADGGRYEQALKLVSELLERQPENVEGHYLSGLIHAAQGAQRQAQSAFNRALYLSPDHRGSLGHLALLMEADNDLPAARRMRARAARAEGEQ